MTPRATSQGEESVLAVNVGSSSLKLALHRFGPAGDARLAHATVPAGKDDEPFAACVDALGPIEPPFAIGHRLVHGGPDRFDPTVATPEVAAELRALVSYAPLHLPAELDALEAARARFPDAIQVVCFDTGFHRALPAVAKRLPLPRALDEAGLRRYGFHGLSYEHVVSRLDRTSLARAVIAHLGSGSSLVAIRDGAPVDTTMGLTPAGGVMMGTRTGDLDPGVILRLLADGWDRARIERLVEHESGLRGVSGSTSDMRALLEARCSDADAALAVELYVSQIAKAVGAFATVLGGLSTLVFTGGIGERSAPIRAEVCARLAHLGVTIDEARNQRGEGSISTGDCAVRVVPTDEELVIARAAWVAARGASRRTTL